MARGSHPNRLKSIGITTLGVAGFMTALDILWLGVFAQKWYAEQLGPLQRQPVLWGPAALFYAMYVGAIMVHGVLGSTDPKAAGKRGAGLGFVAYATYELTNWAVIANWPALLVPVDLIWGVFLTTLASWVGRLIFERLERS